MGNLYEIRETEEARSLLLESFLTLRLTKPTSSTLQTTMVCCAEMLSEGNPIPLVGLVSDILQLVDGATTSEVGNREADFSGLDHAMVCRYEDQVIGKLFADMSFERGVDAIKRYEGRDRVRASAYLVNQLANRCKLNGFVLSTAVAKSLISMKQDSLHDELQSLLGTPRDESVVEEFNDLIHKVRNCGQLLGAEDIFELESGTALSKFGQRIALRQVLQAEDSLHQQLPKDKPRGMSRTYAIATNILEEDYYPIGGFTSISNRGTMESLLRSELAYIEDDQRPDVFDIKYVRDELLYYSRDENQFFRRRVCFMFVLDFDLTDARMKDVGANWQRIISLLGTIVVSVRCLMEWLSSDALRFEVHFVEQRSRRVLEDEFLLLETIFRDDIAAGLLTLEDSTLDSLAKRGEENARSSLCHSTVFGAGKGMASRALELSSEEEARRVMPLVTEVVCANAIPRVRIDGQEFEFEEELDPWRATVSQLFRAWL